ncbi:MAG TPA: hypothetical protein VFL91_27900, partial [Thermomicrobiales bacterium]|nr:hypothetical protein [Thermomicrobiales bacterium]
MSDHDRWQEHNDAYLAAALAWLRLRLLRRAGDEPGHGPPATDEAVREAAAVMRDREAAGPPPALALLGERFGLSRFEREVLLLCAALELDTRVAALCARAQDDPHRPYPTFALALALFDDPAWDVLSPERPLRRWQLLEITQPGAQPLTASPLRADERIVNYLKGLNYLDDRLAPLLAPLDDADPEPPLPPSQRAVAEAAVRAVEGADGRERLPVLQLLGTDAAGKRLIAARAAAALGLHLYRLPAEALPATPGELESFARLWQRECVLLPIALYLDAHDLAPAE